MLSDLIVNCSGKCPLDWTYPQCSAVKCRLSSSFKNSPSKYVLSSFVFSHSIRYLVWSRQRDDDFDAIGNFPNICPPFIQITRHYEAHNKITVYPQFNSNNIRQISSRVEFIVLQYIQLYRVFYRFQKNIMIMIKVTKRKR